MIFSADNKKAAYAAFFIIGAFMRGNKPLVLPGVKEGFSKGKTGELKASPNSLDNI